MNQTQRKYVTQRVTSIRDTKINQIRNAFSNCPLNTYKSVPSLIYPSINEVIRALAGLKSTAVLTYSKAEIDAKLTVGSSAGNGVSNYQLLAKPINEDLVNEIKEYHTSITTRYEVEVTNKVKELNLAFTSCMDNIMLGEDQAGIMEAINQFEALVI